MKANKTMFVLGLLIVISAVTLLLLNVIESGGAAAIGILGIGLIAASGLSFKFIFSRRDVPYSLMGYALLTHPTLVARQGYPGFRCTSSGLS